MGVSIPIQQRASDYPVLSQNVMPQKQSGNPDSANLALFQTSNPTETSPEFKIDFSELDAQMAQWGLPYTAGPISDSKTFEANTGIDDLPSFDAYMKNAGLNPNGTVPNGAVNVYQNQIDNDPDMQRIQEMGRDVEKMFAFSRLQRGCYSPAFLAFLRKQFRESAFSVDEVKNFAEIFNQQNPEGIKVPTDRESILRFSQTVFNFRQGWYSSRNWRSYQQFDPYLESQNLDALILIQSTELRGITRPDVLSYLLSDEAKHLFNKQGEISQDALKAALSRYNTDVLPAINAKRALDKQELLRPIELPESNEQWAVLYQAFADSEPTASILNRFMGDTFSWSDPTVTHTPVLTREALQRIIKMQQGQ